jgi:spore maturation protein CgeB
VKFTIFGLTISSSWGNGHATPYRAIVRALARMGHRVTFYEKDVHYYASHRDLPERDACEVVLYPDWDAVRTEALREAASSDVTINASYCPGGARIIDDVLGLARPLKVFYDLDTPVTLENLSLNDVDYLRRDQVPNFDLYLSFTGGRTLDVLHEVWNARRVAALYGCVDPDVHTRVWAKPEFRCDLSYMGTFAADRQQKLERLFMWPAERKPDSTFVLAGSLYPWNWEWPKNLRRFEHIAPNDHPAFYSSSRMTLNITRKGMATYGYCPSGRLFEAAACSTPLVSDWFEGLDAFFTPNREIMIAHTEQDVMDALGASDAELERIAREARQRTLDEHTGEARTRQVVEYCEAAMSGRARSEPASAA